jgi:flagellar biosynthetic protein FliQ
MTLDLANDLLRDTLITAALLAAPVLGLLFAAGFLVNVLQTVTNLQDATLSFIPRLLVGAAALLWALPWMLQRLCDFSTELYQGIGAAM